MPIPQYITSFTNESEYPKLLQESGDYLLQETEEYILLNILIYLGNSPRGFSVSKDKPGMGNASAVDKPERL